MKKIYVKPREFWIHDLSWWMWWEIDTDSKRRPCLIVSTKLGYDLISIIPITTKFDGDNYVKNNFYIEIENYQQYWLKEKSYLACNQLRVISKERLIKNLIEQKIKWERKKFKKYNSTKFLQLKEFLCKKVIKKESL